MDHEQLKELRELLMSMNRELGEIKGQLTALSDVKRIAEQADKTADKALQSTDSAHKRLDRLDKIVFWAGTTVFTTIIVAVVTFIVKGGLSNG